MIRTQDSDRSITDITAELEEFSQSDKNITLIHEDAEFGNNELCIVLDSSFNPPNRAHLVMLKDALRRNPWSSSVLFLLSTDNSDKGTVAVGELAHRVAMMPTFWRDVLAELGELCKDVPLAYGVTKCPLFFDKLAPIKSEFSGKLCFLTGFDTVLRLLDSKYYDNKPLRDVPKLREFMDQVEFQSLTRKPDNVSKTPVNMPESIDEQLDWLDRIKQGNNPDIPKQWGHQVHLVKSTDETVGVHSTGGRHLMHNKMYDEAARILTPQVIKYIIEHNLY